MQQQTLLIFFLMMFDFSLSASIILLTMYGYEVSPKDDPLQAIAEDAMTSMSEIAYPGASIINILPVLRLLPAWFPGAKFHQVARVIKPKVQNMQDVPYKYVQDTLVGPSSKSYPLYFVSLNHLRNTFQGRRNCFSLFGCKRNRNVQIGK